MRFIYRQVSQGHLQQNSLVTYVQRLSVTLLKEKYTLNRVILVLRK